MKKKYRLLKEFDFQYILRKGRKINSKNLICYFVFGEDSSLAKLGIIIPKKKCKLSCKRKYLKRIFWALNSKKFLDSLNGIKCVFFYRDSFYEKFKNEEKPDFEVLKNEYQKLIFKIVGNR